MEVLSDGESGMMPVMLSNKELVLDLKTDRKGGMMGDALMSDA